MTFICYIDRQDSTTPHMAPLSAETLERAHEEARALLAFHASGRRARIYQGDREVATVERTADDLFA